MMLNLVLRKKILTLNMIISGFLASAIGCSTTSEPDYSKLGLVDLSGSLTLDGKPLGNVEIRLETTEDFIYSYGITDDQGAFRLMFDSRKPGIIPGKKRLMVLPKSKGESESEGGEGEDNAKANQNATSIPACYGRESKKIIDIESSMRTLTIELKSDCSQP